MSPGSEWGAGEPSLVLRYLLTSNFMMTFWGTLPLSSLVFEFAGKEAPLRVMRTEPKSENSVGPPAIDNISAKSVPSETVYSPGFFTSPIT